MDYTSSSTHASSCSAVSHLTANNSLEIGTVVLSTLTADYSYTMSSRTFLHIKNKNEIYNTLSASIHCTTVEQHQPNNSRVQSCLKNLSQLPVLIGFDHDITPPIKLSINIHLRKCRPHAIFFHSASKQFIFKDIHTHKRCIHGIQNLHHSVAEATHWHFLGPFHKHYHFILRDECIYS